MVFIGNINMTCNTMVWLAKALAGGFLEVCPCCIYKHLASDITGLGGTMASCVLQAEGWELILSDKIG
jgi:hypothetical protein